MRAIILKEFLKIKFAFFAFLGFVLFGVIAIIANTLHQFNISGKSEVIFMINYNFEFSFLWLDVLNIFFAVILGFFCYYREKIGGRLRLHFHFPLSNLKQILIITALPLCFLIFVFLIEFIVLFGFFFVVFPLNLSLNLINLLINNFAFCVVLFFAPFGIVFSSKFSEIALNIVSWSVLVFLYFKINPDLVNFTSYSQNDKFYVFFAFCLVFAYTNLQVFIKKYKQGYLK